MKYLTKEQVDIVFSTSRRIASEIVEKTGGHEPTAIYYAQDGVHILSMSDIMLEAEKLFEAGNVTGGYAVKDKMADVMRKVAADRKAFGVVTVIEAWSTRVNKKDVQFIGGDEPGMGGVVAELPRFAKNREEVLIVAYEFKMEDGAKAAGGSAMKINRDGEKTSLGPMEILEGMGHGRMSNIIQ